MAVCISRLKHACPAVAPSAAWWAQVLGIIGALDPHTHKTNQADLQGEGKLEAEGVRPQRYGAPPALGGEQGARTIGEHSTHVTHIARCRRVVNVLPACKST